MTELRFVLPAAPGVNNLYANVPGRGRVKSRRYEEWIRNAGQAMWIDPVSKRLSRWKMITEPVEITIINGNTRLDVDAPAKAVIDLMVSSGVIPDDRRKYVRRVVLEYGGDPKQVVVIVREFRDCEEVKQ